MVLVAPSQCRSALEQQQLSAEPSDQHPQNLLSQLSRQASAPSSSSSHPPPALMNGISTSSHQKPDAARPTRPAPLFQTPSDDTTTAAHDALYSPNAQHSVSTLLTSSTPTTPRAPVTLSLLTQAFSAGIPDQASATIQVPTTPISRSNSTRMSTTDDRSSSVDSTSSRRRRAASRDSLTDFSPSSVASSCAGLPDIPRMTPLPSPIVRGESPGPWHRFRSKSFNRPLSRGNSLHKKSDSVFVTIAGESVAHALAAHAKRQAYQNLRMDNDVEAPSFQQDVVAQVRAVNEPSKVALNDQADRFNAERTAGTENTKPPVLHSKNQHHLHIKREEYLPPKKEGKIVRKSSSTLSVEESPYKATSSSSSISSVDSHSGISPDSRLIKREHLEDFEATEWPSGETRRWRGLKVIGVGTLSRVILATSEELPSGDTSNKELCLDSRKLVAVKIIDSNAAGGISIERVESSLKRELEMLKKVRHPSLIRLRGYSIQPNRALIVLNHYPGGDLFEFTDANDPSIHIIRRIFAETVGALAYLHGRNIAHRDVKLENILLTNPAESTISVAEPFTHPTSLSILSDLGLSKEFDPASPLLETRCGSDDYASPELIMAQPYDGRETDAWSLGVTLYALLEGRLPFNPLPPTGGQKVDRDHPISRAKVAHRIARVEWKWYKVAELLADESLPAEDRQSWEMAKEIVEGLLKRARQRLRIEKLVDHEWVKGAVKVPLVEME